jgi:ribosomal protein S18 acetylase RimI-like enzyme
VDEAVTFREMVADDIPAGLALCRASGWNQVERDWRRFLETQPGGAIVAERDSRIIGTVATIRYGRRFAWVAMVLVDPAERGRGVGRALLTRGLSLIDDVETPRLDATPAGEPLYKTLGFVEESRLSRLQLEPGQARPLPPFPASSSQETTVRPLVAADWDSIAAFDAAVFGADRRALLQWLWEGAPEYAWVATDRQDAITGYIFGRHGHLFEHLGPIIAHDAATAARLVAACLPSRGAHALLAGHPLRAYPSFVIDAPADQADWRRFLADAGFVEQRPFFRMSRGRPAPAGQPHHLFASVGPEFG